MKLRLAPGLSLPPEAVTEVFGLLGARGSGKTTTASVLAEEMLRAHLPLVILDPTDAWWGLRSSKDGKSDGFPITILGGDHGDAPLEETAGKVLADLVAEEAPPLVLSLRLLSEAAKRRFVADFAERLYEKNRNALHVVIDEADEFAPQRIPKGGERCFGAVDRIVRRGRSSGLGVTLISQRSAAISKDVLSQCATLIAHRASHPRDLEPVLEWMRVHASKEQLAEVHGSIAKLSDGEAWVMSPEWLAVFGRFQMRDRETFNSSATPKAGERRIVPKRLAPVDLKALEKRMADTIERAKAEDPRVLRTRIAHLEDELRQLRRHNDSAKEKLAAREPKTKRVEVPVLKARDRQAIERASVRLDDAVGILRSVFEGYLPSLSAAAKDLRGALAPPPVADAVRRAGVVADGEEIPTRPWLTVPPNPLRVQAFPALVAALGNTGKRRILIALAQNGDGLSKRKLSILTGISQKGGTWRTYVGELRGGGLVEAYGDGLRITAKGREALGSFEELPTGEDLVAYWRGRLGDSGKRRIFDVLVAAYPRALSANVAAQEAGIDIAGGTWRTYIGELRGLELVTGTRELRASEDLFS